MWILLNDNLTEMCTSLGDHFTSACLIVVPSECYRPGILLWHTWRMNVIEASCPEATRGTELAHKLGVGGTTQSLNRSGVVTTRATTNFRLPPSVWGDAFIKVREWRRIPDVLHRVDWLLMASLGMTKHWFQITHGWHTADLPVSMNRSGTKNA